MKLTTCAVLASATLSATTRAHAQWPAAPLPTQPMFAAPMLESSTLLASHILLQDHLEGVSPLPTQESQAAAETPGSQPVDGSAPTQFPHSKTTRWVLSGQANIIFQAHGPFHSPYEGTNSLLSRGEYKASLLGTLYTGFQLNPNPRYATDALLDVEAAGGRGISEALGLAGFTNLDVVRNPSLGSKPYLAQYMIHQVFGFSDQLVDSQRSTTSLATRLPIRRLELFLGRMGLPDFFDTNAIGTDSHLQFLNWSVDNNGAWDYAANTRGYSDAAVLQYTDHDFVAMYGLAAMPVIANGIDLQYQLRQGSGQNVEFDLNKSAVPGRKGAIRLLGFVNHANMGDYRQQNQAFLAGLTPKPDITAHTFTDSMKYGVGLNFEQELNDVLRVYGRFGWNEGQHESFAYTEID
jgi:high affinity Mn2+ porin